MMKALILWSSRTGNTKSVGQAIYDALPCEKDFIENGRYHGNYDEYDLVFVGFWAFRRGANMEARNVLSSIHNQKVAIYATAGTYPDSPAAKNYLAAAAALLPEDNILLGSLILQGKVHSFHTNTRNESAKKVHPLTPERLKRLQEAEKHPNEEDFQRAALWAKEIYHQAESMNTKK